MADETYDKPGDIVVPRKVIEYDPPATLADDIDPDTLGDKLAAPGTVIVVSSERNDDDGSVTPNVTTVTDTEGVGSDTVAALADTDADEVSAKQVGSSPENKAVKASKTAKK